MNTIFSLLVDPATFLVLDADSAHWVGRALSQWVVDPSREDLQRVLTVAMRGVEPLRLKVRMRVRGRGPFLAEIFAVKETDRRGKFQLRIFINEPLALGSSSEAKAAA